VKTTKAETYGHIKEIDDGLTILQARITTLGVVLEGHTKRIEALETTPLATDARINGELQKRLAKIFVGRSGDWMKTACQNFNAQAEMFDVKLKEASEELDLQFEVSGMTHDLMDIQRQVGLMHKRLLRVQGLAGDKVPPR